jgi:hypothetical protein
MEGRARNNNVDLRNEEKCKEGRKEMRTKNNSETIKFRGRRG